MKTILPIVAASFLGVTCLCPVFASDVESEQQAIKATEASVTQKATEVSAAAQETAKEANNSMQQMSRASKIIGAAVVSPKDESLGSINDLVIDPETNQIAYAVVSYGAVMGVGGKLFGMPWKSMLWNQEKHHYVINVDKAILAKSPGFSFDADKWPSNLNEFGHMVQGLVNP